MSDTATETPDFEAKLEALAEQGFHLVFSDVDKFIIEKVDHVGTISFEGKTLAEVIGFVEDKLASHPGAPVTVISRSDGLHESVDGLQTQAGKPEPAEGQSGTSPTVRAEPVDLSAAPLDPAEQADEIAANAGAGANVAPVDAEEATLTDPEAQAEATAEPEANPVDTSGPIAETPGEVATGVVGTEADTPESEPAPAPEGAVES